MTLCCYLRFCIECFQWMFYFSCYIFHVLSIHFIFINISISLLCVCILTFFSECSFLFYDFLIIVNSRLYWDWCNWIIFFSITNSWNFSTFILSHFIVNYVLWNSSSCFKSIKNDNVFVCFAGCSPQVSSSSFVACGSNVTLIFKAVVQIFSCMYHSGAIVKSKKYSDL